MVRVPGFSQADPLPGGELAAFVAAIESGSIQGAADALELTQSATTKRIQNLERRLGQPLLSRSRHGTVPAELGSALYPLAKRALQALADIGEAADAAGTAAKTLRLSASLTLGEFLVPGWLGAFRAQRPDVRPQLEVINSNQVARHVADGDAEIGFVEGHDDLSSFETLTVAHDELLVVVSAAHHWARRRSVRARELTAEPYLTRERLSGTRAVADEALQRVGVTLAPTLEAASLQSLKRAIGDGGFTVISALAVEAEQRAGSLVALPVKDVDMKRPLKAVRRRSRRQTEPATALWNWLGSHTGT